MNMIEMIDVENDVYEKQLHCQGLAGDSGPCSFRKKYEDNPNQFECTYDGCIITEQHAKHIEGETEFNTEGDDDLKDMIITKMVELKVQSEIEEYEEAVNER